MDISFIVPCYNEEQNVALFFAQAEQVLTPSGYTYEYVFVNDGSTDGTRRELERLFSQNPGVPMTVVNFSRNFGKESALFAGLKQAAGDAVCIIDADLQQEPAVALKMYEILRQNPALDCVAAFQKERKEGFFMNSMKAAFYKLITRISDTELENGASDFRVFRAKVKDAMLQLGEYHRFSKGIFSWVGFSVHYMEYEAKQRNAGNSKWGFFKLLRYALNGIMAFSVTPLRLATGLGTAAVLFDIVYILVTLLRKAFGKIDVSGFTQLVMIITFFSGVILMILGIIGEYIAKIYQQVKNRPIYITDQILKR